VGLHCLAVIIGRLVQGIALLTCIREAPGSNLGRHVDYTGWKLSVVFCSLSR
jgi:hypothetical protein